MNTASSIRNIERTCTASPIASAVRGMVVALPLALAACAHVPTEPEARVEYERNNDPAEPTNRAIFAGNKFVDDHALQPVARGYEKYIPGRVRKCVHNFVGNLGQPAIAMNDVLQGNFGRAWNTFQRFALNTTVGGAGFFDVATDWNRPEHQADFGQTLGVWGVGAGPSVQLPLFGPSNVRDSFGKVVDAVTNPVGLIAGGPATAASGGVGFVDKRASALAASQELERDSLDYYAAVRSVAAQRRAALVTEGRTGEIGKHESQEASQASLSTAASPASAAR